MRPARFDRPRWKPAGTGWAERVVAIMIGVTVVAVANAEDDLLVDEPPPVTPWQRQTATWDFGAYFDRSVFEPEPERKISFINRANASATAPPAETTGADAASTSLARVLRIAEEPFARIDSLGGLTEPQRRKLRLAIESDARRTADAIDPVRRKYLGMKLNQQDGAWPERMKEFRADVEACRKQLGLLSSEESLFMKALPTTLAPEQHARLATETDASLDFLWRTIVARVMVQFDDVLGLDEKQHENLESLLLAERPQLPSGGRSRLTAIQLGPQLVALSLTRIEKDRLASAVSPRQENLLRSFTNTFSDLRQILEHQGLPQKER